MDKLRLKGKVSLQFCLITVFILLFCTSCNNKTIEESTIIKEKNTIKKEDNIIENDKNNNQSIEKVQVEDFNNKVSSFKNKISVFNDSSKQYMAKDVNEINRQCNDILEDILNNKQSISCTPEEIIGDSNEFYLKFSDTLNIGSTHYRFAEFGNSVIRDGSLIYLYVQIWDENNEVTIQNLDTIIQTASGVGKFIFYDFIEIDGEYYTNIVASIEGVDSNYFKLTGFKVDSLKFEKFEVDDSYNLFGRWKVYKYGDEDSYSVGCGYTGKYTYDFKDNTITINTLDLEGNIHDSLNIKLTKKGYTFEEITVNEKEDIYLGDWKINRVLDSGKVTVYSSDDINYILNQVMHFSKEEASCFGDGLIYLDMVAKNPTYSKSVISKEDFESGWRHYVLFENLGITGDTATKINARDSEGNGCSLYIKDSNTMILYGGGVFFELERIENTNSHSKNISREEYIEAITDEEYVFVLEDDNSGDNISYNDYYYIYDSKTNKNHKLILPWCNNIVSKKGNTILYSGKDKIYAANLETLKVKSILDGDFCYNINWNVFLKEKLYFFCDLTEEWLYYCELDFYKEIPKLYKLNVNTGEKVFFENSSLVSSKSLDNGKSVSSEYSKYIFDERGMIPQRGKCSFESFDDLNIRWNQVLTSFSFGEKGLFDFNGYTSWENNTKEFHKIESDVVTRNGLVIDDDYIYVITYDNEKSLTINTYDYSMNLVDTFTSTLEREIYKFGSVNREENYIFISSWFNSSESTYLVYDIINKTLTDVSEEEYFQLLRRQKSFFNNKNHLYTHENKLLHSFEDYESIKIIPQDKGAEFHSNVVYANDEFRFAYKVDDKSEYIYILAFAEDGLSADLFMMNNKSSDVNLIAKDCSHEFDLFNDGESFVFKVKNQIGKSKEIKLDVTTSKPTEDGEHRNDFYIDMTFKGAADVIRKKNLETYVSSTVPIIILDSREKHVRSQSIGRFDFGDTVISIKDRGNNLEARLVFDEKTNKLVEIRSTFPTLRGFKVGVSLDEMKSLYGEEYNIIELEPEIYGLDTTKNETAVRYEYKFDNHYFNVVEKNNSGVVDYWYISKFGTGDKREDSNEKFWLVLYDQFVDLTVPLTENFIKLLNKEQMELLRNAYYARHGYILKSVKYKEYFSDYYWYRELFDDVDHLLSPTDIKNIEMLLKFEKDN
ncbi:YARHG domain-containing protein [Oceanirhabdus sp. W0125-5]|uniref:YARHG domain-containing protein n=1 Tax=Oceanirhabdus sp. W0125-5 TaxID=2999116 RepID=UPI0022F2A637|nr:YARHG domain-containing protein [Oceanirhabdus sp. W0125-5]WBW97289.1 YARHG domain-containing protein [Oceanirhabdus sp. W0125-5]